MGNTNACRWALLAALAGACGGQEPTQSAPTGGSVGGASSTSAAAVGGLGGATSTSQGAVATTTGAGGAATSTVGSVSQGGATSVGGSVGQGGSVAQGGSVSMGGSSAGTGNVMVSGAPTVSNLTIEPNPNSTISAYVSWTTDEPGNSEVQFGVGAVEYKIVSDALVTDHQVTLIGMHADDDYVIKAVSTNELGSGSADGSFSTGSLPSEVPIPTLTADVPQSSQSGWTLANFMVGNGSGSFAAIAPPVMVMYDEQGVPVWYYISGNTNDGRGDISVDLTENNTILVGPAAGESPREVDLGGNVLWEGPPNAGAGETMTHHAGLLDNDNIAVIRDTRSGQTTGSTIEELTRDNQIAWSWSLLDHTSPANNNSRTDWCHGNSVTVDFAADIVYLNCRFLGLFKVNRSSGDILWHMAGTYDGNTAGDFSYSPPASQFSDAHDPEIHADGTIMFYDNGGFGGGNSRVVEYSIDEASKVATLVWEFPGSFSVDPWYVNDWYSPYWGDADVLANNNVLVAATVKLADAQTRIFEVTREGQVVWEVVFPADIGSYRAQRISPPLVERIQ